jgi:cyclopropane fatty-acyl-phospholipid synthase-like methyltransferase
MPTNQQHKDIWNQSAYDAWHNKYGAPNDYADKLAKNPQNHLGTLIPFLGEISGKKILNLMGSNGSKAICLTLLGAEVTIVDFSDENALYCKEMSEHLGCHISYIVSDVLTYQAPLDYNTFDIVIAEMGILHYFTDLAPFMQIAQTYLKKDGLFILRDFHPVSTKLIVSRGSTSKVRKHKVQGDYFSDELIQQDSALKKYQEDSTADRDILLRKWTLGEIVTATACAGFQISALKEEPNLSSSTFDHGIPKTFILVSKKC